MSPFDILLPLALHRCKFTRTGHLKLVSCAGLVVLGVAACDMPPVVYGVIDLYGRTAKVTLVCDARTAEASDRCPVHQEEDFNTDPGDGAVIVLPTTQSTQDPLRFHDNCGQSSVIVNEGRTALRLKCALNLVTSPCSLCCSLSRSIAP